jgi:hypothetical protein
LPRSAVLVGGLALTLVAARYAPPMLYGVNAYDPFIFFGASTLVVLVSALAAFRPALHAMGLNPVKAPRQD